MKRLVIMTVISALMLSLGTAYAAPAKDGEWDYIETFDDINSVNDNFDFYFTSTQYDRRAETLEKNWTLSDGTIKRTKNIDKGGSTVNIAIMTCVYDVYDNFELSVDFKAGQETLFWPVVGIRQQIPGKYYLTDGGGAGVFMQQSGLITMWGPIVKGNKDGHLFEDKIPNSSGYDPRQWHNMHIYANGTDVTVYIDDTEVLKTSVKSTDYEKGYISLISVNNDCEFDNFKIRALGSSSKAGIEINHSKYAELGQSLDDIIKNGYSKQKATVNN